MRERVRVHPASMADREYDALIEGHKRRANWSLYLNGLAVGVIWGSLLGASRWAFLAFPTGACIIFGGLWWTGHVHRQWREDIDLRYRRR